MVDPTYGHGRTHTDVQKDTVAYRQDTREVAVGTSLPTPVFQSDFLFVQLPGVPLALHCVCNGTLLQEAKEEYLSFTTVEYTHLPQPGVLHYTLAR